jgi:ABC-type multidrug transport system ATPase subunit
MEALTVVGGWYGGHVDSEPDLPEAQPTPQVDTPAARTSNTNKKAPTTPRRPATPRTSTARTPKPAADAATGTGSPVGETASKPATPRKTTPRSTAKPAGQAGKTTQPRTTRPKPATASTAGTSATTTPPTSATSKSTTSKSVPAKRPPAAKTTARTKAAPLPEATEALLTESPAPAETLSAEAAQAETPTQTESPTQAETPTQIESPAQTETAQSPAETETTAAPKAPVRRAPSKRPAAKPRTPATKPKTPPSELASQETAPELAATTVETVEALETVETIENVEVIEAVAPVEREVVLKVTGLVKRFDDTTAVAGIDLEIVAGSFFGIVGPNGAGKTTTLSMVTGLLRPDAGSVTVHGADVWTNPVVAKRTMGVLPDRLRLFDRLTGSQLLYYSGILHGLDKKVVRSRSADLAAAFGLEESLDRLVTDYSAGMTKKVAIAAAMIHSPRLLVLDEPFESVDPVSAANVIEILQKYVAAGGTVVMSSHTMNLIERICDSVAVVVNGAILASGTMAEVRNGKTLEERFVELAGGRKAAEGMEWLHKFSD